MITLTVEVEGLPGLEHVGLRVELPNNHGGEAIARDVVTHALTRVLARRAGPSVEVIAP